MQRIAECACGQLRVTVQGDPFTVAVCSCTYCQKRTGSAFGMSSYFEKEDQLISIEGDHKGFRRTSQRGRWFEHHFCPECGSTVFWYGEMLPDKIGIAAGSFTDPDFPAPEAAVWDGTRYKWIEFPASVETYEEQRF